VARLARRSLAIAVRELTGPMRSSRICDESSITQYEYGWSFLASSPLQRDRETGRAEGSVSRTPMGRSQERRAVVVPFNLLCLPVDLAMIAMRLVCLLRIVKPAGAAEDGLLDICDSIAVFIMGPLCYLLSLWGRPLESTHAP